VKSFVGEGEIPPAGFTPCQSQACFKAGWIKEKEKKNIHCCWAEWKIT